MTVINRNQLSGVVSELIKANKTVNLIVGITTAYEISDNQLREYLITNYIYNKLKEHGYNSKLILINDTNDTFTLEFFNKLVKFDPSLTNFKQYLGLPISEIPSPYGIHNNYVDFFQSLFLEKLAQHNILPDKIIQTHKCYESGEYDIYIDRLLNNYENIIKDIATEFNIKLESIYKPICANCHSISSTKFISYEHANVIYFCKNCKKELSSNARRGKFIWKIDCGLRWNLTRADFEAFPINFLTKPNGTYFISKYISEKYLDKIVPDTIRYSYLKFNFLLKDLFLTLPTKMVEELFIINAKSDKINEDLIEKKARAFKFESGFSYYETSKIIYSLYPALVLNHEQINRLNNLIFNFKYSETFYKEILELIRRCYYFGHKFIKVKNRINHYNEVNLDTSTENLIRLKEFLNITDVKKRRFSAKTIGSIIYSTLFNSDVGPSIKTLHQLLPTEYKMSLINRINKELLRKNNEKINN